MAHFHYTIMGGLVFTFFAAIYYWGPKMTGFKFNETLAKVHFWSMFIAFNSTFAPLFALGLLGMPRRVVTYPSNLQGLNVWVSVSAFVLGISMLVFLYNLVWSQLIKRERAEDEPVALEVGRVPAADPGPGLRLRADPRVRRRPVPVWRAADRRARARWAEGRRRWKAPHPPRPTPRSSSSRPSGSRACSGWAPASCAAWRPSSSSRSCSRTSTCARSTQPQLEDRLGQRADRLGARDARRADPQRGRAPRRRPRNRRARSAPARRGGARPALGGAAGDRLDDARVRAGERRLRERVRRLDGLVRGVHAPRACSGSRPRSRPPGAGDGRAFGDRAGGRGRRAHRSGGDRRRARGVLVLLELLRLQRARCCSCSCTCCSRP